MNISFNASFNSNASGITHLLAVGVVAAAAFLSSAPGQAFVAPLIHQYPTLSGVAVLITTLAALYHNPNVVQPPPPQLSINK